MTSDRQGTGGNAGNNHDVGEPCTIHHTNARGCSPLALLKGTKDNLIAEVVVKMISIFVVVSLAVFAFKATGWGSPGLGQAAECLLDIRLCVEKWLTVTPTPGIPTPPSPTPLSTASPPTLTPTATSTPAPTLTLAADRLVCPPLYTAVKPAAATHLVLPGESLSSIASLYGTTWPVLVDLNVGYYPTLRQWPHCIRDGWWLVVP
jgi:hypothetical protein